jgi:phosphopantothenoylcysteine decarboxylase/phosphopantothenate--cysteine ligase
MNIALGITGGIAAYKTPELVRRLRERGAAVQVVMTNSAREFVTETSLQAVAGRPVRSNLWDKEAEASMSHIELARWADVVLIAPATAEIMARLASGAAADLLTTLVLATEAPVAIAPAMNHVMWNNPAVRSNRAILEQRGVHVLGPGSGSQACGETGSGRMLEPDDIAARTVALSGRDVARVLAGKTVVITAGPTREPVDPVRYLSNRSSGKMGFALAAAAERAGASVRLIAGPVSLDTPRGVERIDVVTAADMREATEAVIGDADIFVATAAVADYRPATVAGSKIKKSGETMTLELVRTDDILAGVAARPAAPFTVGFAAETDDLETYARGKLEAKGLDMIVANCVRDGKAFDADENAVEVFWAEGREGFPLAAKSVLAADLVNLIASRYDVMRGAGTEPRLSVISNKD